MSIRILKHFQWIIAAAADLIATLDKIARAARLRFRISPPISRMPSSAGWVFGTLMFGEYQVRTGHLIVGFLNSELKHKFLAISRELAKIKLET